MVIPSGASLRRVADGWMARAFAGVLGSGPDPVDAVVAGRLLLAVVGVAVLGFAPLLDPSRRSWWALIAVSAGMGLVLVGSLLVDWVLLPVWATIFFPLSVSVGLAVLGLSAGSGFAAPLTGILTLCFAYLGVTQPPGTAVFGLPVAGATFLCAYDVVNGPIITRLLIAVFVWTLLSELLARVMRRLHQLTATWSGAAHLDELTGVANRRDLRRRLAAAGPGDTVVMCDLDHFKSVNDTLGHAGGDRVLAEFGAMLSVVVREGDYIARYGGEEFLLLLPATSTAQSRALLERVQRHWATLQPVVTFSAGVATCQLDRLIADTIAAADMMLYAAKTAGRNQAAYESTPPSAEPAHA